MGRRSEHGMKRVLRRFVYRLALVLLDVCGINALFRFLNRNKGVILWYHGVCQDGFRLLDGYDPRQVRGRRRGVRFPQTLETAAQLGRKYEAFLDQVAEFL